MQIKVGRFFLSLIILMSIAGGVAEAKTRKNKGSFSGTGVQVPLDIDSDSCTTAPNGATVCTDTSTYNNFAGSGSTDGAFTAQNVIETKVVAGSGCNIAGTIVPGIASCTLAGSSEQGCEVESVGLGAFEVDRDSSTGDLLFLTVPVTVCVDLSSPPAQNLTATFNGTITGGTGKNAGATGTRTGTLRGRNPISDAAGNGFGWFEGSFVDIITTP